MVSRRITILCFFCFYVVKTTTSMICYRFVLAKVSNWFYFFVKKKTKTKKSFYAQPLYYAFKILAQLSCACLCEAQACCSLLLLGKTTSYAQPSCAYCSRSLFFEIFDLVAYAFSFLCAFKVVKIKDFKSILLFGFTQ